MEILTSIDFKKCFLKDILNFNFLYKIFLTAKAAFVRGG